MKLRKVRVEDLAFVILAPLGVISMVVLPERGFGTIGAISFGIFLGTAGLQGRPKQILFFILLALAFAVSVLQRWVYPTVILWAFGMAISLFSVSSSLPRGPLFG